MENSLCSGCLLSIKIVYNGAPKTHTRAMITSKKETMFRVVIVGDRILYLLCLQAGVIVNAEINLEMMEQKLSSSVLLSARWYTGSLCKEMTGRNRRFEKMMPIILFISCFPHSRISCDFISSMHL